ncbi:TetR/AcrR family transcriptional regulator [Acidovorax sp. Root70]|uniref:TetR/AcrR family transcriptional regulator n=1 Tax=Acidovorax sp. Root70 TaxID=1736590 RepID=UPI0006F66C58|nr:TetR/AcrR family transcriptional regulator [Acidovorax sp. Root70]KRB40847.1 TetR family transcriptional regulator [Acidovorax sp. Root70]
MKVSKAQAAENRQGILDAASRLYRERGLTGVGVADITRDAGLTHGGLYRHFASKDALVQEACARAFDWSIAPLDGATPNTTISERIQSYLSPQHRDSPGTGCPAAALAVDAARAGSALSEVFAQGIERNIGRFAQLLADNGAEEGGTAEQPTDRARAMQILATMVGGLVLARATAAAQPALSNELLTTLQSQLIGLLGEAPREEPGG